MTNPTRDTAAGRIYNDLRNLARRTGRPSDQLMLEYVMERFLFRLSNHPEGGRHFVLKGGLLLAQFGARRMTRDIDILGRSFSGGEAGITRRIAAIAATEADDGVVFDPTSLSTVPIRQDDEYHGLRLTMAASLSRARLKLQLDVSFGDPVTPEPKLIDYPQTLEGTPFPLYGYPMATVIAEKLTTAVALGDLNTRDRDYADLYQLLTRHRLDGNELIAALTATAEHRAIQLRQLSQKADLHHAPHPAPCRQVVRACPPPAGVGNGGSRRRLGEHRRPDSRERLPHSGAHALGEGGLSPHVGLDQVAREVGDALGRLAALGEDDGAVIGLLETEGPDHPVLLDPERELAAGVEPDHVAVRLPRQLTVAVGVGEPGTQPDLGEISGEPGRLHLRAPLRHPADIADDLPDPFGGRLDLDAVFEQGYLVHGATSLSDGGRLGLRRRGRAGEEDEIDDQRGHEDDQQWQDHVVR
jgi:predicted nucleotidyltransferase component of viral defense system